MTFALDKPLNVGGISVRAVAKRDVQLNACGRALLGRGCKHPLLILLSQDGKVFGLDLEGQRLGEEEIEARFPGILSDGDAT